MEVKCVLQHRPCPTGRDQVCKWLKYKGRVGRLAPPLGTRPGYRRCPGQGNLTIEGSPLEPLEWAEQVGGPFGSVQFRHKGSKGRDLLDTSPSVDILERN